MISLNKASSKLSYPPTSKARTRRNQVAFRSTKNVRTATISVRTRRRTNSSSRCSLLCNTFLPVVVVISTLFLMDPYVQYDVLWVIGGITIFFLLLETAPSSSSSLSSSLESASALSGPYWEEVRVTVYPLGIQIGVYAWGAPNKQNDSAMTSPVFLPLESVLDCIVQEYVQAHKVSSHVVFRVRDYDGPDSPDNSTLIATNESQFQKIVPAFPGAELSFVQCLSLKDQIQRALRGR